MEVERRMDVETSPSYFDPENLSSREQFRRYRKRQSTSGNDPPSASFPGGIVYGSLLHRQPNAAKLVEEIKQERDVFDTDILERSGQRHKFDSLSRPPGQSLKLIKHEDETIQEGDTTFTFFASFLDSALRGLISFPDLILHLEKTCRDVAESIRYNKFENVQVFEDKMLQQKAQLLLDEAASWSLLWFLFGKENVELPGDLLLFPATSHQTACRFVMKDHTAQLCLRIVLWLEGLASAALDLEKVRGFHVGSCLSSTGVWHHTQRLLKRKTSGHDTVQYLDFDAPTRESARIHNDDKKQDELLLEDVWNLLRAGRLMEACELCRSAGQAWRSATLCPFGGLDLSPSVEAMVKNGKTRMLQAIELESGIGHQWHLWKWASYCASEKIAKQNDGRYEMAIYGLQCSNLNRILPICTDWESACWAITKCWLDAQVDLELAQFQQDRQQNEQYDDDMGGSFSQVGRCISPGTGPENWPYQVLDQQPRDIPSLLQKLHSADVVHEVVSRACHEQHRQIEMNLMVGDVAHLLNLLWSWVSPSEDNQNILRPSGNPEMIRFGAHMVIILRHLLDDEMSDALKDKLMTVGDLIIHMYAMLLFTKKQMLFIGLYASQLTRHLCVDLFVNMMELSSNSSYHVKYKLFLSALEYLSFSLEDESKACFEEIIERVLSRSRQTKISKYDEKLSDVVEQVHLLSFKKANVVQWLCFTPPSTIPDFEGISMKLLLRALIHSNVLFREFALASLVRIPEMPEGAYKLLASLAEPLKQKEKLLLDSNPEVSENIKEFEDWNEYYSWDATYRQWLTKEIENAAVPQEMLSLEEKDEAISAARKTLELAFSILLREEGSWMGIEQSSPDDMMEHMFIELHVIAMLRLPSGECVLPDSVSCTTLTSALYSTVSGQDVLKRELMVTASVSSNDQYSIEVKLRCLATEGDGLGIHETNDGGLLAYVLAAGLRGELSRFQAGVTMEVLRLDAWYSDSSGSLCPATYIIRGLSRRCCLPELVLRCMQVSVVLAESGESLDHCDQLIEIISSEHGMLTLFSQHQSQEFLRFYRECVLCKMELEEDATENDP